MGKGARVSAKISKWGGESAEKGTSPTPSSYFFSLRSWQSCRASSVGTYRAPERLYAGRKGISKMILSIHYQWKPLTYHDRWKFLGLNFALLALLCYYVHLSKICHCCI